MQRAPRLNAVRLLCCVMLTTSWLSDVVEQKQQAAGFTATRQGAITPGVYKIISAAPDLSGLVRAPTAYEPVTVTPGSKDDRFGGTELVLRRSLMV
jgi:hypothetical protein